jgi:hypothetical protein
MKTRVFFLALFLGAASVCPASFIFIFSSGGYIIRISSGTGGILPVSTPPPVLTAQPVSIFTPVGHNVVFVASASGAGPLYYRWQKNGVGLANGGRISGAHSSTFHLSNVQTSDSGKYRVVVSNAGGYVVSQTATLSVY